MRTGTTYTRHFDLDTRQHELLGIDLGEGAPRRALVIGMVLFGVWSGGMVLLFGLPGIYSFTAYFLPPLLTTWVGMQRSRRFDRRLNITQWAIFLRYLTLGHRPIICGGRRAAARSEWIPRRARWGARADTAADVTGGRSEALFGMGRGRSEALAGAPLELDARPRLYGPDELFKARKKEDAA
ncbi:MULTISPECIES: hypothetical protein [Streptomyces]|uniref:hypothetical protein n=1 Tax=Streptomyces TaxID=1883 RepID=UPI00345BB1E9